MTGPLTVEERAGRHRSAPTVSGSGLPLLDVARWPGHESIREPADTYGHLTPYATGRAVRAMDVALTRRHADVVLTEAE